MYGARDGAGQQQSRRNAAAQATLRQGRPYAPKTMAAAREGTSSRQPLRILLANTSLDIGIGGNLNASFFGC
jgi:hypothetical protein